MKELSAPSITTIIPTYRRPQLLKRAVRSALNQSYPHLQVCVYDNASGDETPAVVAELAKSDARVKYYCHSKNVGPLNNFQFGMERVDTPFFSFVSDDDLLLPEFYEIALQGFTKFPDAMFSAGATIVVNNESIPDTDKPEIKRSEILAVFPRIANEGYYAPPDGLFEIIENHLNWNGVLFRKEAIAEVGRLDPETGDMAEQDFLFRTAARFPLVISSLPSAVFVDHELSHSHTRHLAVVWPSWFKIISNLTEDNRIPAAVRVCAESALTKRLHEWLLALGVSALRQKKYEETYEIVKILRNKYHLRFMAFTLYLNAKMCQHLPASYTSLMYSTLKQLNKVRIFWMSLRSS